ncbi:MAG: pilus assembly protein [Lachnospiraceae bacterium]|nr:pilus assembly protein [Lachnospiraceae bacterium]
MRNKYLNGYITVELSLLFPIIICVICFLMYMGFIYHDRVVAHAWMYKMQVNDVFGMENNVSDEQRVYDVIKKRMIVSELNDVEYERTENNSVITMNIKYNDFAKRYTVKTDGLNRCENLLRMRFIKEVIDK